MSFKKIKTNFLSLGTRVNYIPDFNNLGNIAKVFFISYLISCLYTVISITNISSLFDDVWKRFQLITPYLFLQMIILIVSANLLKKIETKLALFYIFISNFVSVYIIYSILHNSFYAFFNNAESAASVYASSLSLLVIIFIYFDWKEKVLAPSSALAQLSFLQSKMKPHFLFNTINSIMYLIKKNPEMAKKMLLNLSDILRASLKDEKEYISSIYEEITLAKKYLEIEKIRLEEKLIVNWNIDDKILHYNIPKLLLQPLIENAVVHGVQSLSNESSIEIKIHLNMLEHIVVEIKNQYNEANEYKPKGNNITLNNLKNRLAIYYEHEAKMNIVTKNGSFYVMIEMPTTNNFFNMNLM